MSLDFSLHIKGADAPAMDDVRIPIREDGQIKMITREEWEQRYPDREPTVLGIDFGSEGTTVFMRNITHNLNTMASHAGLYPFLWRPNEYGFDKAHEIIDPVDYGLSRLKNDPDFYKQYNPSNGWGDYEGLVQFAEDVLEACKKYPEADIHTTR